MSVSLRPAAASDEDFLLKVYAGTRLEELSLLNWDAAQKDAFLRMQYSLQSRAYQMQYPDAEHYIILSDGQPIGRLIVIRALLEMNLCDIALLPEERNAGIGTRLIRDLMDEAAQAGKPLRLRVIKSNPARRLYERMGFVRVGENDTHLQMEWPSGIDANKNTAGI